VKAIMTVKEIICSEIIATGSNKLELQTIFDAIEANNRSKNTQEALDESLSPNYRMKGREK